MKRPARTRRPADRPTSPRRSPSRAELQEQVSELLARQAAISEVLRAIASSPNDLQPIFQTILDSAARLCLADAGGTLRLLEKEGVRLVAQKLSPAVSRWYSPPTFVEHGSYIGRLVASSSPVHIPDLAALGEPDLETAVKAGIRTILVLPMLRNNYVIGALTIWRERVEPFTDKQIELLTDFAAQAAIALEITRRERQYRQLQAELAHANRASTLGQLSASIAHEVKQPIAVAVTGAQAARRWLNVQPANLVEVDDQLLRIAREGQRAGEVVDRLGALIKKTPARKERLDINQAIREVSELAHGEAVKNCVSVQTDFADDLPLIDCDRVQLQQVMLNLIVNAIQSMSGVEDGNRELHISTVSIEPEGVCVGVRDTGPGLSPESLSRLFEPFYTTKPDGMGMGLSICRSIIEAHGGRLWATRCEPRGALFQFTVPAD
jgi:C4-dicarboxylate-specific signal transduction histidine kinase